MQHRCGQVPLYPLAERHLPDRFVYELFDSEDLIHHIQSLFIFTLIDLIDMLQKLEAFSEAEIPVELRSLSKYNADVPDNLFPVPCDVPAIDQYASQCGGQDS